MADSEENEVMICPVCKRILPGNQDTCPNCDNVFDRQTGQWRWKIVSSVKRQEQRTGKV